MPGRTHEAWLRAYVPGIHRRAYGVGGRNRGAGGRWMQYRMRC